MGHPVNYLKIVIVHLLCGTIVTSLMIPMAVWTYFTDGSILKVVLYFYAGMYFTVAVGGITLFSVAIFLRLRSMNEILMSRITVRHEATLNREVFATLAAVYEEIIEICDEINFCYGLQVMMSFGLIFVYSLFTLFTAYTDFVADKRLNDATISSLGFSVYYDFVLIVVIKTFRSTERQVSLRLRLFA